MGDLYQAEAVLEYSIRQITLCRKINKKKLDMEQKFPVHDTLLGEKEDEDLFHWYFSIQKEGLPLGHIYITHNSWGIYRYIY